MSNKTFSKAPDPSQMMETIPCPSCGGTSFRSYWQSDEALWQRCRGCSLILQNPQPRTEDILKRYDEVYFEYENENEENFLNLMILGLKDISFFDWAGQEGRSFLDVGCATGRLAAWLNEQGWLARGVEVCREAAERGRKSYGVDIFPGTLEEAAFENQSFHYVHNSHVIEHVNRPDLFMEEIYRILKPGGYYICTTPNADGFQARLFGSTWRSAIPDHLTLFSKKSLRRLAESKGFRVVDVKTWGGLALGYGPAVIKKLADRLAKPLGFGDVMLLVLQKPSAEEN